MLKEEQVGELLHVCEELVGGALTQIRGNLTKPATRSSAVFELLAIQAFSAIGRIDYEPFHNSPDLRVTLADGSTLWVEVAFLHEKFWELERQSRELAASLRAEGKRVGVAPEKLWCEFRGHASKDGYKRELPQQHQLKQFLRSDYVRGIFERIAAEPNERFSAAHPEYTVIVSYLPQATSAGGGGVVQEAPKHHSRHQLFKTIKQKAQQHSVEGMRLLCVGSDQSNALTNSSAPGTITPLQAVRAAFSETSSIGGVVTVSIRDVQQPLGRSGKRAFPCYYANGNAKAPLTAAVQSAIERLDFNQWHYYFQLSKYETPGNGLGRKLIGSMRYTIRGSDVTMEIPCAMLIEMLAGRANMLDGKFGHEEQTARLLSGDYRIESCTFVPANIQAGEGAKILLVMKEDMTAIFDRLRPAKLEGE